MNKIIYLFTICVLLSKIAHSIEIVPTLKDVGRLERAIDAAIEAFERYDSDPKDEKLTFAEINKDPENIISNAIFTLKFDLNKDGHLTVAEMAAAVFADKIFTNQ